MALLIEFFMNLSSSVFTGITALTIGPPQTHALALARSQNEWIRNQLLRDCNTLADFNNSGWTHFEGYIIIHRDVLNLNLYRFTLYDNYANSMLSWKATADSSPFTLANSNFQAVFGSFDYCYPEDVADQFQALISTLAQIKTILKSIV